MEGVEEAQQPQKKDPDEVRAVILSTDIPIVMAYKEKS